MRCCVLWFLFALMSPAWAVADEAADTPRPATTISARELLELYGVDESYFRGLIDGRPLHDDESEALLRTVYTLRRLRALDLHRAQHSALPVAEIVADPAGQRGQLALLTGRVKQVTAIRLLPELVDRFELDQYYRCELELEDEAAMAIVYCAKIPAAWQSAGAESQRVSAWGFFLKNEGAADAPRPVFVAPRLAWHPPTPLGELGMDVSLLEDLQHRERLGGEDRECFYQLLDVAGRLDDQPDLAGPATPVTAELAQQMFATPHELSGQRLLLNGLARRAVRIRVNDADIVERFGIDHYYEVEIFVDVPRLAPAQNPLIHVCCVRELPAGFPVGEDIAVAVRLPVFFVKLWTYRSSLANRSGENFRQVAPLCIGRAPILVAPPESTRNALGAIAAGILATLLLIAGWAAWRNRRDDSRHRWRLATRVELPTDAESLPPEIPALDLPSDNRLPR